MWPLATNAYADPGESYYKPAGEATKVNEGWDPNTYMLDGVPHIGYGFNKKAHPELGDTMTKEQAEPLFWKYFQGADKKAMTFAGDAWGGLDDNQKAVLSDMAYNMDSGLGGFVDMKVALDKGDDLGVRREMKDSDWFGQVKDRGPRNVNKWTVRNPTANPTFASAYADYSKQTGMNPNPDDPKHFYDYRKLYDETGSISPNAEGHLPSKYKLEGHPRTVVNGVNTITGKKISPFGEAFQKARKEGKKTFMWEGKLKTTEMK